MNSIISVLKDVVEIQKYIRLTKVGRINSGNDPLVVLHYLNEEAES